MRERVLFITPDRYYMWKKSARTARMLIGQWSWVDDVVFVDVAVAVADVAAVAAVVCHQMYQARVSYDEYFRI